MARSQTDRSTQVTVRLEPKILEGLREISDRIGIAPSTLAGVAIGEFVAKSQATYANQERMTTVMAEQMAKVVGDPLASLFAGKSIDDLKGVFKDD